MYAQGKKRLENSKISTTVASRGQNSGWLNSFFSFAVFLKFLGMSKYSFHLFAYLFNNWRGKDIHRYNTYIHVHTCMHTYIYMYVCMHAYTHTYREEVPPLQTYTHIMHTHTCMCNTRMYVPTHIYAHTCMCACTHTYIERRREGERMGGMNEWMNKWLIAGFWETAPDGPWSNFLLPSLSSFSTPDCLLSETHSLFPLNLLLEKMFSPLEMPRLLLGQVLREHHLSHCLFTSAAKELEPGNRTKPAGQPSCLICFFSSILFLSFISV